MMIRKCVSAVVVFLGCLLSPGMALAMGSDLTIQAGLARQDDGGGFVIYKHTTAVPFVPKSVNPNYYFGVAATTHSGKDVMCHAVLYIPRQNALHGDVGDDTGMALISSAPYSVVTSGDVDVPVCQTYLSLDDNDVPGQYIVELFVDGKMAQRVVFNVHRK